MTSNEVAKLTGVARGTIARYVAEGLLRPRGGRSHGVGDPLFFDETDVQRLRAIVAIRHWFGDGKLATQAIELALPQVNTLTRSLVLTNVELPLE